MPPRVIQFSDAIGISENENRHLLLGNGFSRAWKDDIFSYNSLYDQADFSEMSPRIRDLFTTLNTKDFEIVMRHLREASKVLRVYSSSSTSLIAELERDAELLKSILVQTIADHHPETPSEISDEEYNRCRTFLEHFCQDRIYSLNYDLLLYWVLMHFKDTEKPLKCDDGFRTPDSGQTEYVSWDIEKTDGQNVFHLHGALYLFDAGSVLKKYTWTNTGIRLIEQVRDALNNDLFPLIVSEGTSHEKQNKIMHSSYLSRAQRSISHIKGSLFIYGHSLAENDDHILKLLGRKSKLKNLFVSLFGDPDSVGNRAIISKADEIKNSRGQRYPLEVHFYDAGSSHVWR